MLEGQVVRDPGGTPVKKAEVQLIAERQEEGSTSYTGTTGADGHFKIEGIRAGRYRAFVEHTGLVEIDKKHRRSPGTALSFDPGKDISGVVLRMLAAAVIVGRVVDEDGDPMPRVDVSVLRYGYDLGERHLETTASGSTNDLGEYRIPDLLPGRYLVVASPTPAFLNLEEVPAPKPGVEPKTETALLPTFYPGTTDRSQATFLDLRVGDEMPLNFNLAPSPVFHVRGTVANFSAHGAHSAVLVLRPKDTNVEFAAAQVDKDGKFEIPRVGPGLYSLMAMIGDGDDAQFTRVPLEVINRDVNDVRIVSLSGSRVRGQLRIEGNRTVDFSSLWVLLRSSRRDSGATFAGGPELVRVKNDGTFELKTIPAGTYSVRVEGSGEIPDSFLKSVKSGGSDVTNSGLTVGGGGTYALDLLIGVGAGKLEGVATDSDDHPVADAVVVAVPTGDHRNRLDLYQKGVTDQRGTFHLSGLTPGDYALFAFESVEEGAYYDAAFLKPYEGSSENVHLDENSKKTLQLKVIPAAEDAP
jgi:hypothetical protein